MKIHILQENLNRGVSYLAKAIPTNPQLPILASILIEATQTSCVVAATDLYFGVRAQLQASTETPGRIVVPGKQFKELISSLPTGKVTLEYKDGSLFIQSGKIKAKLQCQSAEEYPQFPQVEGETITFTTQQFQDVEQYIGFSASSDQARPVLTSILFSATPAGMQAVTTDGFRLSMYAVDNGAGLQSGQLLIQAKAMQEVNRIVKQLQAETVSFTVSFEQKQVYFVIADVEVFVRLIEGEYPPYEKIIPSVFTTQLTFAAAELEENLKRALIFARDASNIIRFEISNDSITLLASSPSLGTFTGELSQATVSGDAMEIAFNARYIQEILKASAAEKLWMGLSDSLKPVLCRVDDNQSVQYVVMPFKVNK